MMNYVQELAFMIRELENELAGARIIIMAICRKQGTPIHLSKFDIGLIPEGTTLIAEEHGSEIILRVVENQEGREKEGDDQDTTSGHP